MNFILSFLGGDALKKIAIAAILLAILAIGAFIKYQSSTIIDLRQEIESTKVLLNVKQLEISGLEASIASQNDSIEKMKIATKDSIKQIEATVPKIITKYRTVVETNSTCEQKLDSINSTLKKFNGEVK